MKNIKKYIGTLILVFTLSIAFAQTPPPPNNNGSGPGSSNNPVGGGAPVGSGLIILTAMAGGYGFARWYKNRPVYTIVE